MSGAETQEDRAAVPVPQDELPEVPATATAGSGFGDGDRDGTLAARAATPEGEGEGQAPTARRPRHQVLTRDEADLLVPRKDFGPVRDFLVRWDEALTAALERRFWGFGYQRLGENLENFGRFFLRSDAPVPQLWFGIAWAVDDAPGTLPSWGASLQLDGEWIHDWERNVGGLRSAMDRAARDSSERLGVYRFDEHVELAEWRSLEWLLEQPDHPEALVEYWTSFLELLARAEVPEALDGYLAHTFGYS